MRYLDQYLAEFATEKMVFITGPRQVGKTTISKIWLDNKGPYLNWDIDQDRSLILSKEFQSNFLSQHSRVVIDEIHKFSRWKNLLKGAFDKHQDHLELVVTGSAKLDVFKKSGDSLLGRYEKLRLHPFSLGEINHGTFLAPPNDFSELEFRTPDQEGWEQLKMRSGFPEPFTKNNTLNYNRWTMRRRDLLIREDLKDIGDFKTLDLIEKTALLLPGKIMSPLSINNLREDIGVHHETMSNWLNGLESIYYIFRISPFDKKLTRSLKKEMKMYFWDYAFLKDHAARFENIVAAHLLKSVQGWSDIGFGRYELKYWKNVDGHEIDFIITLDEYPVCAIEAKQKNSALDSSFKKFKSVYPEIPCYQIIDHDSIDQIKDGVRIMSANKFFTAFL